MIRVSVGLSIRVKVPHLRQALLEGVGLALCRRSALPCGRHQQPGLAQPSLEIAHGRPVHPLLRVRRLRGRDGLRGTETVFSL